MPPPKDNNQRILAAIAESQAATVITLYEWGLIPTVYGLRADIKLTLIKLGMTNLEAKYYLDYFNIPGEE